MLDRYGDILTVKEVCSILRISKNMAYALVRAKKIRCVKVGNRIPKSEIVRFLDGKITDWPMLCYTASN